MELKITKEYSEVKLGGSMTVYPVSVTNGKFRDRWEYLRRVGRGKYCTGGYVGVVNATTEDDLVILPKVPGVDFVGMLSRCGKGDLMTSERLDSIVYRFPKGKLVYLDEAGTVFLREYLVFLLGILVIWIRREGVTGIEGSLAVIGRFLKEEQYGKEVGGRLKEVGLDDGLLYGRYDQRNSLEEDDCLKGGRVGAAARVVSALRYLDDEHPAVKPFLVDMPLLFELYCLCLLKEDGGRYLYQKEFKLGRSCRYTDILDCGRGFLIDCKYKPQLRDVVEFRDIGQMGLYSLTEELRNLLGYSGFTTVRILFLYPDGKGYETLAGDLWLRSRPVPGLHRVHRRGVRLPVLDKDYEEGFLVEE